MNYMHILTLIMHCILFFIQFLFCSCRVCTVLAGYRYVRSHWAFYTCFLGAVGRLSLSLMFFYIYFYIFICFRLGVSTCIGRRRCDNLIMMHSHHIRLLVLLRGHSALFLLFYIHVSFTCIMFGVLGSVSLTFLLCLLLWLLFLLLLLYVCIGTHCAFIHL